MTTTEVLPKATRNTRLPVVTIIATTVALLLPLAAIKVLFCESPSAPSASEPSGVQKLRELQAAEKRQLTTYDWIEPPTAVKSGVVRLPLTRARKLILKEMVATQKVSKR